MTLPGTGGQASAGMRKPPDEADTEAAAAAEHAAMSETGVKAEAVVEAPLVLARSRLRRGGSP